MKKSKAKVSNEITGIPKIVLPLLAIILGLTLYYFAINTSNSLTQYYGTTPTQLPITTVAVTDTPEETPAVVDYKNTRSEIYFGNYKDKDGVFYVSDTTRHGYLDGNSKYDANSGQFIQSGIGTNDSVQKNSVKSLKLITSIQGNIPWLTYEKASDDPNVFYLYYSTYLTEKLPPTTLYRGVKGSKLSLTIIWDDSNIRQKYYEAAGVWSFGPVTRNFIAMKMGVCVECDGTEVMGTLLLNTLTKKEVYLRKGGDITLQEKTGTFTYRKITLQNVKCTQDELKSDFYYCPNGKREIWDFTGPVLTQKLP